MYNVAVRSNKKMLVDFMDKRTWYIPKLKLTLKIVTNFV